MRIEPFAEAPAAFANGVKLGGQVFISGQVGVDQSSGNVPADFVEQTRLALQNLVAVAVAGGARPDTVARLTIYVTSMDAFHAARPQLGAPFQAAFGDHLPAMTLVGVTALVDPRFMIEIEGTAVVA